MKKLKLIASLCLGLFIQSATAQSFEEGTSVISVGYGFGNLIKAVVKEAAKAGEDVKVTSIGPLFAKYEYGISDNIGFGLNVAYLSVNASSPYRSAIDNKQYTETIGYSTASILARVNFHFANSDKVDPYFGVGAGYRTGNLNAKSTEPGYVAPTGFSGGGLGFETTLGIRFYPVENFGLYSEVGIAKGFVQLGAIYKL